MEGWRVVTVDNRLGWPVGRSVPQVLSQTSQGGKPTSLDRV